MPGGTKSTCIVASFVLHRGQPDSGESCNVLWSEPTRSLIAAAFSRHLQYTKFVLQGKHTANEATDGCVRAWTIAAVWAERTYLQIHYARIWHGGRLPEGLRKTTKLSKLRGGRLHGYGHLPGQYVVWHSPLTFPHCHCCPSRASRSSAWSSLGGVKRASGSGHSETSLQIGLNHCQVRLLTVSCVLSNQESGKLIFSAKFVGLSSPQ